MGEALEKGLVGDERPVLGCPQDITRCRLFIALENLFLVTEENSGPVGLLGEARLAALGSDLVSVDNFGFCRGTTAVSGVGLFSCGGVERCP